MSTRKTVSGLGAARGRGVPIIVFGLLWLAAVSCSALVAQSIEVTPVMGVQSGGSLQVEEGLLRLAGAPGYGIILGLLVKEDGFAELVYHRQETEVGLRRDGFAGTEKLFDLTVHYFQIGGQMSYPRGVLAPFITLSVGGSVLDPRDRGRESEWGWAGILGVGVKLMPIDRLALRVQARAFGSILNATSSFFCQVSEGGVCYVSIQGSGLTQGDLSAGLTVTF